MIVTPDKILHWKPSACTLNMYMPYLFIIAAAARSLFETVLAIRYWTAGLLKVELATQCKSIVAMKPALADANEWAQVKDKPDQLVR
jgi:Domain of unknown function (DUF3470)